ncbi:MAG: hypothetical protein ACI4GB_08985 [Acutalibacteraceae bacterium]
MATVHSVERAKERAGLNERKAYKMIDHALERCKRAEDFTSWERDYLKGECKGNTTAIAYNNFCYIVNEEEFCVTLYPLPAWFGKKKHFNGKERIRNMKAYSRNHTIA